jgi:hypothetical protein
MLRTVLTSLGIITIIILAVVGYSYEPIADIATLKEAVRRMDKKLDILIKNGKEKKSEQKSENTENKVERKEIVIDTLALAEPALTAVCDGQ